MTAPTDRNRLDGEESPYLRQHADNPVNWQPWDEQALAAARDHDVPIFLSIGYSACHWCHVMEEESFQDEGIAEILNEQFVPIKVDREERPDLDSVYMSICQQVTGRGGWPLNAWLTPEGEPFYVGTYFPPEPKRNAPGFRQLLEDIADSWNDPDQRADVEERARQWTSAIEGDLEETPEDPGPAPDESVLESAADAALRGADREFGGWGGGPKFPQPGRLALLMRAFHREGRDEYREVVVETLDAMAEGGMYDHVGGGFHRYATDRDWTVPHFEKMLYDNALLPLTYLDGYRLTGDERYAEVARETLAFVERELRHPRGGFFSTLDARSEGDSGDQEEGAYYVWTPEVARAAIDDELTADLFVDRYGVTASGNFEGETVLTIAAPVEELAAEYDLPESDVEERLTEGRAAAFDARAERPRPARDEKILAGWNGLAISAFAEAGLTLHDSFTRTATDALSFVHEYLWDAETGRLSRRFKDDEVGIDGYLEDYAFLARGAFDTYQATGEVDYLAFALDLARVIESEFWDADAGTLYFTPAGGESLVARPQELTDASTPSSAGVAAELLATLSHFTPDDAFADVAAGILETHGDRVRSNPMEHPSLVLAADTRASGNHELTVAAESIPSSWLDRVGETYLPRRVLARRPATDGGLSEWLDRLDLASAPPIWAGRDARDGEPTVYACRDRACSPPTRDLDEALDWFGE